MVNSSKLAQLKTNNEAKIKRQGAIVALVFTGILAVILFIFISARAVLGLFLGGVVLAGISFGVFLILRAIDDLPEAF